MTIARAALCIALAIGPASAGPPERGARLVLVNRYRDNPEIRLDRATTPQFLPITMVERREHEPIAGQSPKFAQATGFNIGPCLLVTNHHVAFATPGNALPESDGHLRLRMGYAGAFRFAETGEGDAVASGVGDASGSHDWTVLRSPDCPGKRFGWFTPADLSTERLVKHRTRVFVVSFPGDRRHGQLALSYGEVTGDNPANGTMEYSSSTAPGSSGGAVFVYDKGRMRLVGINKSGVKNEMRDPSGRVRYVGYVFDTYSRQYTNYFINAREVFRDPLVRKLLREDLRQHGDRNPLDRQLATPLPPSPSTVPILRS